MAALELLAAAAIAGIVSAELWRAATNRRARPGRAAYGLLVLVFQEGIGEGLLGFQQTDTIEAWVPLFLFSVLFGLSMDYQVFLLSRIRERFDETGDTTDAVTFGVGSTARIITGAALIIIAVFGFIVLRGLLRLLKEQDLFVVLSCTGLVTGFGLQAFINMASSLQLIPTKGMTLPLVSYGGSSALAVALGMGMLLALTRRRHHADAP